MKKISLLFWIIGMSLFLSSCNRMDILDEALDKLDDVSSYTVLIECIGDSENFNAIYRDTNNLDYYKKIKNNQELEIYEVERENTYQVFTKNQTGKWFYDERDDEKLNFELELDNFDEDYFTYSKKKYSSTRINCSKLIQDLLDTNMNIVTTKIEVTVKKQTINVVTLYFQLNNLEHVINLKYSDFNNTIVSLPDELNQSNKNNQLTNAIENTNQQTSYELKMDIEIMEMNMLAITKVEDNKTYTTLEMFGSELIYYTEVDRVNKIITTYNYDGTKWTIIKEDLTEEMIGDISFDDLTMENFIYLDGKYVGNDINISEILGSLDGTIGDISTMKIKDMNLEIEIKDNFVKEMDINFIAEMMGMSMEYEIEMEFYNYGSTKVTIPEEAYKGEILE